jgi:hypothetical protein
MMISNENKKLNGASFRKCVLKTVMSHTTTGEDNKERYELHYSDAVLVWVIGCWLLVVGQSNTVNTVI